MLIGTKTSEQVSKEATRLLESMYGSRVGLNSCEINVVVLGVQVLYSRYKTELRSSGYDLEESQYVRIFQVAVELIIINIRLRTETLDKDVILDVSKELLLSELTTPSLAECMVGIDAEELVVALFEIFTALKNTNAFDCFELFGSDYNIPINWMYSSNMMYVAACVSNRD